MRVTKLHLLFFFLLAGAGIYGAYFRKESQVHLSKSTQAVPETPPPRDSEARPRPEGAGAPVKALPPAPAPTPSPRDSEAISRSEGADEPAVEKPSEAGTYVVRKGDTLWKIAKMKEHFGEGHRWYDIWKANEDKISDFDHLRAGRALTIPLDKPDGYKWPRTSESRKKRILRQQDPASKIPSTN